jgi:sterol desaturase/sphingolipid hydroxylase (fatty acid hydroxylase superfamily)
MIDRDNNAQDTQADDSPAFDVPRADVPRVEGNDNHWLTRPATIRLLWIGFSVVLAITVLLQFFIKVKGYFGIDGWFGFGAAFGFACCVAMVLVAKVLGFVLKRSEDYYDD